MSENKPKKKKWIAGVDMREFSGMSWKELHDVWPADVRVASEAWKMLSVVQPAWLNTKIFISQLTGIENKKDKKNILDFQDFTILCWIMRAEEGRSNVATDPLPVMRGLNAWGSIWANRQAKLIRLGLVEQLPAPWLHLYRVTKIGRMIIKHFIENVEQAHADLKYWLSTQNKEGSDRINAFVGNYCFEWETLKEREEQNKRNERG